VLARVPGSDLGVDTDLNNVVSGTVGGIPLGEETREHESGVDPGRRSCVNHGSNGVRALGTMGGSPQGEEAW